MTDTTHTPGPWRIEDTVYKHSPQIVSEQGSFIADTDRHNARLIAAAPDLLDALQALLASDLVAWFPQWSPEGNREAGEFPWSEELKQRAAPVLAARAAIAKATGSPQ